VADIRASFMTDRKTLVTAALPYANGPIHLGHLAGCYLPADIYVRYLRQQGRPVLFVCGSDEHGAAVTMKARKEGIRVEDIIDRYDAQMKASFERFGISFDIYSRTSDRARAGDASDIRAGIHRDTAQEFFTKFIESDDLEPRDTEQLYDPEANVFLADRYVTGTCPVCGYAKAYGDQCENCGSTLSPDQLIEPRSTLSGATPVKRPTTHWYLRLDRWADTIRQYIDSHDEWKVNVLGQCRSWLNAKDGLQPRAMTRDLDWGIDVPLLPGHITAAQAAGKKLYVWFDAPIGYISATKEWARQQGTPDAWKDWWLRDPAKSESEDTRLIHFIGKDNIVFHCILFPEMLKRHGSYIRADNVPANEFLNLEGDKLSTSRGWAVWLDDYLNDSDLGPRTDELRYYLTAIAPETSDSNFSWKDFQTRINSELVATFSNYVHRVMTLVWKYYDGKVPDAKDFQLANSYSADHGLVIGVDWRNSIESFRFKEGQEALLRYARDCNVFLTKMEPWKNLDDPESVKRTMYYAVQTLVGFCDLSRPFFPTASERLRNMLNYDPSKVPELKRGHQLGQPEMLFTPIPDEVIARQVAKLDAVRAAHTTPIVGGVAERSEAGEVAAPLSIVAEAPPAKPLIEFVDFERLDLRLGTVVAAAAVPKADKLLQLTVSLGLDVRTIVSGIAQHYMPEQLVGQRVLVVANLAPRKMRGVESQGMILLAESPTGQLTLVQPPAGTEGLPDGSVVR
jgi:methionyl-tRNA synthetase